MTRVLKDLKMPLSAVAAVGVAAAAFAEHVHYASQSLAGEWEMAYRAEAWKENRMPEFSGTAVEKALPGYWEDMVPAFRAAGIRDEFKINPDYVEQSFPMTGWAKDTTLPNISGCFLYRRRFVPLRTGRALLYFDCVRNQVHAWVNGKFVAFRQGFSTPFELAIPDGVLRPGTNEIVLAVANVPNAGYGGREVSGLTTRSIYGSTGGIDGRLEVRYPASDISDAYVTTSADLKTFTIHVRGRDRYRYEVSDGGRVLASGEATGDVALPADGFEFWSPESPKLYRLTLTAGGRSFSQQFGLRRLTAVGEKLFLNGEPVYLRGVTEHGYFARTVHVPRDLEYWRMVARRRKELGFNFVRFHTFVPPEEYLDATDELGMLVHVETPNFVTLDEYEAVVAFARRHPSVVIYCTGNETRIDGGAEKYLEDVAKIVHRETDALFTPMSALRGVEYFIVKGEDDYVEKPLPHNAGRIGRMARYSDLFTSYQLGVASYCSLNKGSPAVLDEWGDAYCGKPRLSHEICIDSSYVDFSTEALYPPGSPILAVGVFSQLREYLKSRGVYEKADLYFRNSCEWMRRIRKFTFEKLRAADRVAGFDFLGDINTHWHTFGYSVGMMDEFYRLKPGETPGDVRRYNSAAVLLTDLGSDFNVKAGEAKRVKLSVSNYARAVKDGQLRVSLVACPEGNGFTAETQSRKEVWRSEKHIGDVPNGKVSALCEVEVGVPASEAPKKYILRASVAGLAENEWEVYAFPAASAANPPGVRVMADATEDELVRAMKAGDRVLLLGSGPFNSLPTTYRIGMAGRTSGNYATVVKDHPALRNFPHDGFCGWQFRRLFEDGRAVQLEAGVPFDPIIDVASSVKCVIRQSVLFEYRVGKGRLLVCSLNFGGDDPAAAWLKKCLVEYASSDEFKPAQELSSVQLHAVLAEPLISADENTNFAKNANDPASVIDYEPPPAPGPESWTFRDDLAKPAAYHAREAYVLDDGYGLEGALSTVKADLARFFASAGKPPKRTLRLRRAKVAGGESYRIDIADDGSATLSAEDDDGMRRGVYYFEDRVSAGDLKPVTRRPWLRHRISRCYFSPIKRPPFNRDELMDDIDYYPDEYLNRLAHEGVNGLWLTITLGDIVETSFNRRDKDAPRRIAKLRRTIEKCARYGIRVWPFCIEPRFMMPDNPIVKEHPEMMSTQKSYFGSSLVCPSTEEGRRYIEEAVADLFRQLPGIPGILNLSHGERPTTCLSQVDPLFDAPSACARCRLLPPAEIHRLAAQSFVNGMRRVNPKAEYLSWLYHPHVRNERGDWVADVPRRLPDGATVLYNFESGALKDQLGRYRAGGDYWLSYVGPSTAFRRVADSARGAGARLGAKIQVGCSHECATVPFVPAPGLLYRKYRAMRTAGCSVVMQCWYFGNYPGVMNKAAGELAFSDFAEDERGFLERLAAPEWGEDAKTMAGIWRDLTDAYSEYPLSNDMQYYGPFHAGVAWPLYARVEMKPLGRTWKPQDVTSGDAIGECLENHSLEETAMLAFRMRRGVAGLAPALNRLSAKYASDRDRLLDLGVAKALILLFESASDIFDFYLHRARAVSASRLHGDSETALGELALMRTAARDAMRTTEEMLPLARADARLGFHSEAENHQFHPAKLEWRLAMLRQTLADIDEIEAALRRGEPYPKSEHEDKAPTMRCGEWTETSRAFKAIRRTNSELDLLLDGTWAPTDRHFRFRPSFADNGDFVLEGEIPGSGPIEVLTLDACGATWSRTLAFGVNGKVSHPSHNVVTTTHEVRSLTTAKKGDGWTFRLVLDASGWGGDKAKRPSWLLVRSGGMPIWPELNPAPEARLNIGNITPDLFGRIETAAASLPERSVYFATHFHNWYEEASDAEVVRYVEELSEWGLTGVAVWFDMHDFTGMDDPAAKRRLERLKLVFRTAKRLGLDRDLHFLANEAFKDSPSALRADWLPGKNGYKLALNGHYHVELCPSKPGATELLLKWRKQVFGAFADAPPTSITPFPYDQGGCTCSNCAPWGANAYLKLCRAIADMTREMYPGVKFNLSTWRFDVFGKIGEWDGLFAKGDELRGWVDRIYVDPADLARTREHSPGGLPVFAMSEISMNGMLPWGGYGANPAPARLQREFKVNPNIVGLRPYSEGIYEDMNKVVALGMLRDPSKTALDVVGDYAARYFGEDTREPVKEAVALMEKNMGHRATGRQGELSRSSYSLKGIDPSKPWSVAHSCARIDADRARRVVELLDAAERTMDILRRSSWRWRILRLRAALDSALAHGAALDEMEPFFEELARIYHVEPETRAFLVPPSKPMWLKVVQTWHDIGL